MKTERKKMKLAITLLLCAICFLLVPSMTYAEENISEAPTRVINLVYDDSGSMITLNEQKVDTWCQAKYAVEVFAAMLGEKDTMNVYFMSDFNQNSSASPKLVLKGTDGSAINVSKVHDLVTRAGNTPFDSVRKAYKDLEQTVADEKWLVVLTDGEFQGVENIDEYFAQKAEDVNIMFLGMGPEADGITQKESLNIYYAKAQTNSEILKNITDICTRIFNSNRLEIGTASKKISFDVPMSELTVFAQGANVEINGIEKIDGTLIKSSTTPVTVKYSEIPATNYEDFIVDTGLLGSIATFKDDFAAGEYILDVSGAETIEVYYKPNIEIVAYLRDSSGNEVTNLAELEAGEYEIEFGFVKAGTDEKVAASKLLGNIQYEAKVINNGNSHEQSYVSGDKIVLEEGELGIDVTAHYLEYHTVSTTLEYLIYKNKEIAFSIAESPKYIVVSEGFQDVKPMVIKATLDGKEFTAEQWESVGIPTGELTSEIDFKMGGFEIQKTDEIGIFHMIPTLINGKPSAGEYCDSNGIINLEEKHGNETWSGSTEFVIKMQDDRPWWEMHIDIIIKLSILGVLLLIALGYVPGVKRYLPKRLKKKPYIEASPKLLGEGVKNYKGRYNKDIWTTLIPYKAETGTIKFVPAGVSGVPVMKVKATSKGRMLLVNTKSYAGKEEITFNGTYVPADVKKQLSLTPGVTISVEKTDWTYTCQPNS